MQQHHQEPSYNSYDYHGRNCGGGQGQWGEGGLNHHPAPSTIVYNDKPEPPPPAPAPPPPLWNPAISHTDHEWNKKYNNTAGTGSNGNGWYQNNLFIKAGFLRDTYTSWLEMSVFEQI